MSENPTFRCGHPRTPENTRRGMCRRCDDAYQTAYRGSETYRIKYRQRYLPDQLARARLRVIHLEREARRLGLRELLEDPVSLDRAWEREVELSSFANAPDPQIDRSAA